MVISQISRSTEETERIAASFAEGLMRRGEKDAFLALFGDLGAGKTAFVRGLASVLAPGARVTSPTYTIVNRYPGKNGFALCHFDMYRIEGEDDLYSIGFEDYANEVRAVEWSEKIPFALPAHYYRITVSRVGDDPYSLTDSGERKIEIEEIG